LLNNKRRKRERKEKIFKSRCGREVRESPSRSLLLPSKVWTMISMRATAAAAAADVVNEPKTKEIMSFTSNPSPSLYRRKKGQTPNKK